MHNTPLPILGSQGHQIPPVISFAVRDFVEFVLRSGDLSSGKFGGLYRAREGIEGHQRIRKNRPDGYRAEVPVRYVAEEGAGWELHGRIDGLFEDNGRIVIEEIKTTRAPFDLLSADDPMHWAQAKVYGHLLAIQEGAAEMDIQLTYLHLASGDIRSNRIAFGAADLASFFSPLAKQFTDWSRRMASWRVMRNASIAGLDFPFSRWRPGQRELADAVADAIGHGRHLFVEAPTGIGKTISILWPSLRALERGDCDTLTFLTARTTGAAIVEDTLLRLGGRGLRLKALTITARDRICFSEAGACDPSACPLALGYYDRLPRARIDAFETDKWDRQQIESLARKHDVCPFALSLDLLPWADVVVGDYNYAFDPRVALDALCGTGASRRIIMVDEAHNLPERARDMFSSELRESVFSTLLEGLPRTARSLRASASTVRRELAATSEGTTPCAGDSIPPSLLGALEDFVDRANARLIENIMEPCRQSLVDACLSAFDFLRTASRFGPDYATIATRDASGAGFRLLCLDAGPRIREVAERLRATVFFSATLTPLEYFREALGGDAGDPVLRLPSPFPEEHLGLFVVSSVSTEFRHRAASVETIAAFLGSAARERPGAHIAYFPSYEYLGRVREAFVAACPEIRAPAQQPSMNDAAKQSFLNQLQSADANVSMVAFAVLGGIFAEGIDLPSGSLAGICIIGVGLPQLCLERDLVRQRAHATGHDGFAVAYAYPGFNRVLQAAGRLIRSETDAGTVVLIDRRFLRADYRCLFPEHWQHAKIVRSLDDLRTAMAGFSRRA